MRPPHIAPPALPQFQPGSAPERSEARTHDLSPSVVRRYPAIGLRSGKADWTNPNLVGMIASSYAEPVDSGQSTVASGPLPTVN